MQDEILTVKQMRNDPEERRVAKLMHDVFFSDDPLAALAILRNDKAQRNHSADTSTEAP